MEYTLKKKKIQRNQIYLIRHGSRYYLLKAQITNYSDLVRLTSTPLAFVKHWGSSPYLSKHKYSKHTWARWVLPQNTPGRAGMGKSSLIRGNTTGKILSLRRLPPVKSSRLRKPFHSPNYYDSTYTYMVFIIIKYKKASYEKKEEVNK